MSYLCRPGLDCGALAIEDMLRRGPDEDKTLTTASRFLMKRGDYARAASLRRRRVERHPDAWEPRVDLATSLLFTRDLAGARDAFNAAARLAPGDWSEAHMRSAEGMAWSYFLEGTLARTGARQLWEKTLDTAPRDSLIALAARIELENLAASRQR